MVLFGGLEIVAAGTLIHRMKQNKRAEMHREAEEALRQRGWVPDPEQQPMGQQHQNEQSNGFLAPQSVPQRPLSVPPPSYVASGWYQGQKEPQYPLGRPSQPYMQNNEYPPGYGPPPPDMYLSPRDPPSYGPPPGYQQGQQIGNNQGYLAPSEPTSYMQTRPHEHHRSRSEDPERSRSKDRRRESSAHHHHRHHHHQHS